MIFLTKGTINFTFATYKRSIDLPMTQKSKKNSQALKSEGNTEFSIHTDLSHFPVSACPAYLDESIGAVCISGTATIQVFDIKFRIVPGMIVTLLPWQLVSIKEISPDFRTTFFRVPLTMFTDILCCLWRLRTGFVFYMRRHIASKSDMSYVQRFLNYCDLLTFWSENSPQNCRQETIIQLLRVYYWTVYGVYLNDPAEKKTRYTYKEELAFQFMKLIIEEHSPTQDVAYYAGRLGISPKYLTNLVRSISGQSARDWIVYHTLVEIKSLLRESSMDIKSIVSRTNFPDQATLSRFFRHYTGMSPSQYRETIHF